MGKFFWTILYYVSSSSVINYKIAETSHRFKSLGSYPNWSR